VMACYTPWRGISRASTVPDSFLEDEHGSGRDAVTKRHSPRRRFFSCGIGSEAVDGIQCTHECKDLARRYDLSSDLNAVAIDQAVDQLEATSSALDEVTKPGLLDLKASIAA